MQLFSSLIVSFGSVNIDLTVCMDSFPTAGETKHVSHYALGLGGKGANQAAAAARLCKGTDTKVMLLGRVGDDGFGEYATTELAHFGVDTSALQTDKSHATGIALINIDNKGENNITVVGGANMAMSNFDIKHNEKYLDNANILLLQLECPLHIVTKAAQRTKAAGGCVILDPAPVPKEGIPSELFDATNIVTPNETETYLLTGVLPDTTEKAAQAAMKLLQKGAHAVVIKMGSHGAFWHDGKNSAFVPSFEVNTIDTVAAGDCFNAGLALALSQNYPLADAVRYAAACGALATTVKGAADSAPSQHDVDGLLSSN